MTSGLPPITPLAFASTSANTAATIFVTGTMLPAKKISRSAKRRFGEGSKDSGEVNAACNAVRPTKKRLPSKNTPDGIKVPVADRRTSCTCPRRSRNAAAVFEEPKSIASAMPLLNSTIEDHHSATTRPVDWLWRGRRPTPRLVETAVLLRVGATRGVASPTLADKGADPPSSPSKSPRTLKDRRPSRTGLRFGPRRRVPIPG